MLKQPRRQHVAHQLGRHGADAQLHVAHLLNVHANSRVRLCLDGQEVLLRRRQFRRGFRIDTNGRGLGVTDGLKDRFLEPGQVDSGNTGQCLLLVIRSDRL